MRSLSSFWGSTGLALASFLAADLARAQVDVNPPLPNVLLLLDTSGSMENMVDGRRPEEAGAACLPGATTPMNRWATLVSVLTGTIQNFSCFAQDRGTSAFLDEYSIGGAPPADAAYHLPFHRILSNGCTHGPGVLPSPWYEVSDDAIRTHAWNHLPMPCDAPGFRQDADGLLDTYRDRVRFGLMTFDSLPHPGTGAAGDHSYFLGWNDGAAPAHGHPAGCAEQPFEVGAKNPAAPPWEGGLVGFGGYDAPIAEVRAQNARIQRTLLALRPFGATPLAGMLADARDFLLHDTTKHPTTGAPLGPAEDPYQKGGCRPQFVLVLSDGEPNLDLRDACAAGDGKCPYPRPWEIAHDLATGTSPLPTFAVGFGLSGVGGVDCASLAPADLLDPSGPCAGADGSLAACCTLARIAHEGGTERAYFASDLPSLRKALDAVLAFVSSKSTSRTIPVFASAGAASAQGDASAAGYQFVTSFDAPPGEPWSGNLERKRYVCENQGGLEVPVLAPVDPQKGDDFEANLATGVPARRFFTVLADPAGQTIPSRGSIRPHLQKSDGFASTGGVSTGLLEGAHFAETLALAPAALGIDPGSLPETCKALALPSPTANACAEAVMRWEIGDPLVPHARSGHELGSIYHAVPAVMTPPRVFLRDEAYAAFASDPASQKRPPVLFVATTDGQLHAFKVAANDPADPLRVDTLANNEVWSFFPPHVLPGLLPTYRQQAFLLDGSPVLRDVVLSRTRADAQAGSASTKWRTVLLAGGGMGGGFYYALDVTDPETPRFLWQLSTDDAGAPLFGSETPRPAIATIAIDDGKGDLEEVAVALLSGGASGPPGAGACPRLVQGSLVAPDEPQKPSSGALAVRCHNTSSGAALPARSLTLARLDTGEILATFRGLPSDGPALAPSRIRPFSFDAPVTGIPTPFPAQPGQVADRVYVGDADGNLYRIDLTSPEPSKWSARLAWDAYSLPGDTASARQPVETPPIVSVDPLGRPVILFSTGDQETFTKSAGVRARITSILEDASKDGLVTRHNWTIPFENGVRVTGPISLFDGAAYFATFTPEGNPGAACSDGHGSVWGVDYLRTTACSPNGPAPPPGWPCPRYVKDPALAPGQTSYFEDQPPGTVVFGVAALQTPSCYAPVTFPDPWLGSVTAMGPSTGGDFQLVFQTGRGGQASEGSKTRTFTKPLPRLRGTVTVDSWGVVLD
ncbi:PilC/PilY family type IV pilus protein [Polyangium fumosum]|nr:PilC/PilY family type IV pilus protein [Polyangium fumosum]